MDAGTGCESIGLAVRRARRAKGLKLAQAAGLVGHSESWLSKVENGRIALDKRADIAALAQVLGVSADTLLGEPAPEVQAGRQAWDLMPLRRVLLDASPDDPPDIPARPVPVLRAVNDQADAALRWSRYDELLPLLPALIGELEVQAATAGGAGREEALRLLIPATATAVITLRYAAQPDLAWVAAERGRQAAALLGDPVQEAAAAYGMAHARSSANRPRALMVMPQRVGKFETLAGQSRTASEVYGMLCLSAALACAVNGDHAGADEHGAEAARVAKRLGDKPDAFELFGVSNVGVWRTSLAVEAGNAERALEHASVVEPRALASNNRRGALAMEIGRALAMQGKDALAVSAFRRAESLSPAQVLSNPLLRELVRNMLDEARRKAGGRELRGLAWRMGLV
jgi:transcriptional regulator with XRE-family HTH domain